MFKQTQLKVEIQLIEEMLGTKPLQADIFSEYVNKAPNGEKAKEENEAAEITEEIAVDKIERSTTVFHRLNTPTQEPYLWDYQIKGFFKEACGVLRNVPGTVSSKVKSYRSRIDNIIFCWPRQILLANDSYELDENGVIKLGVCDRPLRVVTQQGPRVTLARSITVPAGTTLTFEVQILEDNAIWGKKLTDKEKEKLTYKALITEWLNYGSLKGLGQWRNSGKGRFRFTCDDVEA